MKILSYDPHPNIQCENVLYKVRLAYSLNISRCAKERKERNPLQRGYNEGHRCPRGVYSPIWQDSKLVQVGVQMCYYPAAPTCQVMAMFPGTRIVRVLCEWVAAPCCVAVCVCNGVAPECAR